MRSGLIFRAKISHEPPGMESACRGTHSVIWYPQMTGGFPAAAEMNMDGALAEGHAVHMPSICLVEMVYLVEKGRIPIAAAQRVDEVLRDSRFGFSTGSARLACCGGDPADSARRRARYAGPHHRLAGSGVGPPSRHARRQNPRG